MTRTARVMSVLLLLVVAGSAGCDRQTPAAQTSPSATGPPTTPPPTTTPPTSSAPSTTTTAPTSTAPPRKSFIKWLQNFTPTGGGGGTHEAAYTNFMQGRCRDTLELARTEQRDGEMLEPLAEPLRSLYEGAAAACLAALHGRSDLWATARSRAARVDPDELTCWDRAVFRILDTLVDAHRANPRTRFEQSRKMAAPCPELLSTTPDHGPIEGGYTIKVRGRKLPRTVDLDWGDRTVTARRIAPDTLELTVPPALESEDVIAVKIADAPRIEPVYANFTYDR